MEEQLISFETAKLAKEKGFKLPLHSNRNYYNLNGNIHPYNWFNQFELADYTDAPTQSLLAKWLREVHNCFIDILPHRDGDSKNKQWKSKKDVFWSVEVDYYGKKFEIPYTEESDFIKTFNNSYEKALEIGIFQALKLIK